MNAAVGTDPHQQPHDWGGTLEWTSPTGRRHATHPEPIDTTRHRSLPRGHEVEPPF